MDSLITAAARALAVGDPLGALKRVSLRNDPPALALRGIAMAQLGDFVRARALLRSATRAFGAREAVARARCIVAEAEIALVSRDLGWSAKALANARETLERHGDHVNAAFAQYLDTRRLLLIGRLEEAEQLLRTLDLTSLPPALATVHQLVTAGIALRRLQTKAAQAALNQAERTARISGIPALEAEVQSAARLLSTPAARLIANGQQRPMLLKDVERLLRSSAVIVDACRYVVRQAQTVVSLARRPVLFVLARTLAEAWPGDVARDVLVSRAFESRFVDESHRARLRVEMGRLRHLLRNVLRITATKQGFALAPLHVHEVLVLARPVEEEHGAVLAFLADGESWSTSALAIALGSSQRTVQRALDELSADGKVQSFGRGRARRWITPPVPGFTTILLLPTFSPA